MEYNLIVAGVGGQGILTIAQLITRAALARGYDLKQSEVHGMSQRGGAVQSHVRFADHPVRSELIPLGEADLILAAEPLEALRYVEYLRPGGAIVASTVPVTNIADYPPPAQVLERIARFEPHVVVDAVKLARQAGSARAENVVILGAASAFMPFEPQEFHHTIAEVFAAKGKAMVELNRRAFDLGREQALAAHPGAAAAERPAAQGAVERILERADSKGRRQLFEHEVYAILEHAAGLAPPRHRLIAPGQQIRPEDLQAFAGQRVVLKLVSPQVVHKSDSGGVAVVERSIEAVNSAAAAMLARCQSGGHEAEGVLLVEFIEHGSGDLGAELFVGVRATREFGPVVAAGLGGVQTEYLAQRLRPGAAVAMAPALETSGPAFLEQFRRTAAYELLSGQVRGRPRALGDDELVRCFEAFLALARRFSVARGAAAGPGLIELEVNPLALRDGRLIPLDGRGRLGELPLAAPARPAARVRQLLEPRSIAVVGASATRANFGRIILNNIQRCGFPAERLYVVKEGAGEIDGVRCVPSIRHLPERVDLLVAATRAEQVPQVVREAIGDGDASGARCASVILISGAVGETEATQEVPRRLREMIHRARGSPDGGPVFLGANCMGVRSRPGRYDTFFIPPHKLETRRPAALDASPRRLAIVSQSGAFIITRLSNLPFLDPAIAVSLGNQLDLTAADFLNEIAQRDDVDCIGVYLEGFADLDGLEFARAVRRATQKGKVVVLYKAGRSDAGRTAAQGHTASLAGDWEVCAAAVSQAGALVAHSFVEFEQLLELASALHGKRVRGPRIAAVSNAGFETVGMADAVEGRDYRLELPPLSHSTRQRLGRILAEHDLAALVNLRNPLDLTPMADDQAYEQSVAALLEDDEFDAVAVGCVPMTPRLLTTPQEIAQPGSIAHRIVRLFRASTKPLIFIVDSSAPYDMLAAAVRAQGVPVFGSADAGIAALGRYLRHRCCTG